MNNEHDWKKTARKAATLWKLLDADGPREVLFGIFAWANWHSRAQDGAINTKILQCFVATELGRLTRRIEAFEAELESKTADELKALLFEWETQREIEELETLTQRSTEDFDGDPEEHDPADDWKGED